MGKIYANEILDGNMTYAEVRKLWKAKTKQALKDYVKSGRITPEEYEEIVGEPYED